MSFSRIILASLALAACSTELKQAAPERTPAAPEEVSGLTVFTGGTIYTGNGLETVSSVLVGADGRITAVAPPMSEDWDDSEVTLVDLHGAVMFPGFVDGHAHLYGIGDRELRLNLEGTASIGELVTRIEAELDGKPAGTLLVGRGWIETGWPEGRMPVAADLDAVSPDHPVILFRADGHALVANSAAMVLAGISDDTPDVEGGKIERDENGAAAGLFIDNAMGVFFALQTAPSLQEIEYTYKVAGQTYAARGWTGVHNMSVPPEHAEVLARLDGEGAMPLRLYNAYDAAGFALAEQRLHETDTITNRAVKIYMDGALGSRGALLIEPYSDRPATSGLSLMEPEKLDETMAEADARGVQLAIHAIGDLANRRVLQAFEQGGYGQDHRWRIEHTQILHPDDIARLAELGLVASMQPSHAIGDLKFAPDRLGLVRLRGAYAWQSLLNAGAVVLGGSDAPVEVGSPLIEFYAAVARRDLEGWSGEGWHPEEALTREQALALFTTAPAYGAFMEDELGTIEPGKRADFTVFDRDLMTVPEADILTATALMTVVEGEIVYSALAE